MMSGQEFYGTFRNEALGNVSFLNVDEANHEWMIEKHVHTRALVPLGIDFHGWEPFLKETEVDSVYSKVPITLSLCDVSI